MGRIRASAAPRPRDASADLSLCSGSCCRCCIVALVWSTMSACALRPRPTTTRCVGGLYVSVVDYVMIVVVEDVCCTPCLLHAIVVAVALVWSTMSACALMPCPTTTRCVGGLCVSVLDHVMIVVVSLPADVAHACCVCHMVLPLVSTSHAAMLSC